MLYQTRKTFDRLQMITNEDIFEYIWEVDHCYIIGTLRDQNLTPQKVNEENV